MCFAYGIGDTVFRGRPIVGGGTANFGNGRALTDIDSGGREAFFDVRTLQDHGGSGGEAAVGNLVVVALPLVGEKRVPPPSLRTPSTHSLTMGVDLAQLATGRRTGTSSRLVPGTFDTTRRISIMDVRLLTVSPEEMIPEGIEMLLS